MEGVKTEESDAMPSTIDDHWLQKWTEVEDMKDDCDTKDNKAEGGCGETNDITGTREVSKDNDHWLQEWTEGLDLKNECDTKVNSQFKAEEVDCGETNDITGTKGVPDNSNEPGSEKVQEGKSHRTNNLSKNKHLHQNQKDTSLCYSDKVIGNLCVYKCNGC